MELIRVLKDKWWLIALVFIFLFSYHIRSINIIPDRLLSFDPIFQYRFTKYFADWGHLPSWDELTYYVGKEVTISTNSPFMIHITSLLYWIQPFGLSLLTVCALASALYGALIVIPAFLLGRELSNNYGGLMSAILIGTAPQIMIRTFGSSYDTDQLVLFFILLTLYLGYYTFKKKTITSFSIALIGFTAFMLTWGLFTYSLIIVLSSLIVYFVLKTIFGNNKESRFKFRENIKTYSKEIKQTIVILTLLIVGFLIVGFLIGSVDILLSSLSGVFTFATQPEVKIVNISIAELQPFDIFNPRGWAMAMGNFIMGDEVINAIVLALFFFLIFFGFLRTYKKGDIRVLSFLLTLFLIGTYTTIRGIRFTEFTSTLFIILIGTGFGHLISYLEDKRSLKIFAMSIGIIIAIYAINFGMEMGQNIGPDINSNWDDAWNFFKTQTPESSLIGTWWDPGHMIAGIAERRNIADGAHCGSPYPCFYGINDRIVDLGKIMATNDENESLELIKKYQGNSPKVYWIASDDLIAKWQWPQYFGTGCDGRTDPSCPLYYQIGGQAMSYDNEGNVIMRTYGNVIVYYAEIPIPIFIQGINAAIFDEIIFYNNTDVIQIKFTDEEKQILLSGLKPLERQLNIRFTNQTVPITIWMPRHFSYIVLIPPHQRNNVFTRMFFLEGQDLEHFKQVFRNEQVKIYEII